MSPTVIQHWLRRAEAVGDAAVARATTARDEHIAELVRQAAAGEDLAWDSLVRQYRGLLWQVALRHGLNEADAADVVQTTWLRLFEHVDDVREPARVASWLTTTAQRESLRCVARRNRVVPTDLEATLDVHDRLQPPLDEELLNGEQAAGARAALAGLPSTWRSVVELLMQDPPLSYEEIGARLGVPVGSIGPTRGRSLRRLRAVVDG
jgi:RNA polymerase sigma factor (sigma-70 family)